MNGITARIFYFNLLGKTDGALYWNDLILYDSWYYCFSLFSNALLYRL